MSATTQIRPCEGDPCGVQAAGHHGHTIQISLVSRTRWGWRHGTIRYASGGFVAIDYRDDPVTVIIWHHHPLDTDVGIGQPVRLHEEFGVLFCGDHGFSVKTFGGLGTVPTPPGESHPFD